MNITEKITITNEDNMEMMSRYPDNYFDLAIVDPPYGIGRSGHNGVKAKNPKHNWKTHEWKSWDDSVPTKYYFKELFRVSKNQIIWGANYFTQYLPSSMGWIFWDKGQDLTMSDGELAFTSFQIAMRRKIINRGQLMIEGGTQHPTQKPILLYKWILDKYAKQGDKILDTHLGSGSIAIACHDYAFELTACELDNEYYDLAIKRIKNHVSQQKLF
jgi:site-specific DNA-methyltransferase (adenine-specific)